jgi:hypothetical protein
MDHQGKPRSGTQNKTARHGDGHRVACCLERRGQGCAHRRVDTEQFCARNGLSRGGERDRRAVESCQAFVRRRRCTPSLVDSLAIRARPARPRTSFLISQHPLVATRGGCAILHETASNAASSIALASFRRTVTLASSLPRSLVQLPCRL